MKLQLSLLLVDMKAYSHFRNFTLKLQSSLAHGLMMDRVCTDQGNYCAMVGVIIWKSY